jgi:hypothetical protein
LADPHQINALIASAICECRTHHSVAPEEAKTMAKCIIQQLSDAGFMVGANPDAETSAEAAKFGAL